MGELFPHSPLPCPLLKRIFELLFVGGARGARKSTHGSDTSVPTQHNDNIGVKKKSSPKLTKGKINGNSKEEGKVNGKRLQGNTGAGEQGRNGQKRDSESSSE